LEHADEPLGPKELAELAEAKHGATRELLSQMVKDGQVKNLGRGAYALPDRQNIPDNADTLTNEGRDVRSSVLSGHFRKEEGALHDVVTSIHGFPGGAGCYSCDPEHPARKGVTQ
jgi:hypothetical protein